MFGNQKPLGPGDDGYALMTVVVIALVVIITGMAIFAMASYESKSALYRQASSEAFYLADAAVERARAKFLEDRTWRDGWSEVAQGRGTYDLVVTDTTFGGRTDVVQLLATGRVRQAERRIEVMAKVPPTGLGLGILIRGDAHVDGNLCLNGSLHIVGDADLGPHDAHLACGSHTEGFDITPPPIYTDPGHHPNATYYSVRGNRIGNQAQARIYNALGVDITTALGDSLVGVTSYHNGSGTFRYEFDSHAVIERYFDESTGLFRREPGDQAVVVNFGEGAVVNPPGVNGVSAIEFDGSNASVIRATVINTRFTGVTDEQRVDPRFWIGGLTTVKQIRFEPAYGIALITWDFQKQGGSHVQLGTPEWPALVYVTRDVKAVNSNFTLVGAITVLGNWNSTGDPDMTWDPGFFENLPTYLFDTWPQGVSGTLQVLRWRELASADP